MTLACRLYIHIETVGSRVDKVSLIMHVDEAELIAGEAKFKLWIRNIISKIPNFEAIMTLRVANMVLAVTVCLWVSLVSGLECGME